MILRRAQSSVPLGAGKARVRSSVVGEEVSVNDRAKQLLYFLELFSTQPELVSCQGQIPDQISFQWSGNEQQGHWTANSEAIIAQGDDAR